MSINHQDIYFYFEFDCFKVLQELLQEIAEEQMKGDPENINDEDKRDESGIVLVTCKDERTCFQLQECILRGPCQVIEISINLYSTTLLL